MLGKRKLLKQSALLAGGYAIGQGSAFLSQLSIKHFSTPETLGLAVLIVGYCSFSLQFSDLGNSNRAVPLLKGQNDKESLAFLKSRALIGAAAIGVLIGAGGIPLPPALATISAALLVALAFIRGLTFSAKPEYLGDYKETVKIQSYPWIGLSLGLATISVATSDPAFTIAPIAGATILSIILFARNRPPKHDRGEIESISPLRTALTAIHYIGPALCGQIWGRTILILTKDMYGLSNLGVLGIAKYAQVGLSLIFSFWLRPIHRTLSVDHRIPQRTYTSKLALYVEPLIAALLISGLAIGACLDSRISEHFGQWPLLLFPLPFYVCAAIASQHYSSIFSPKTYLTIELASLFVNVLVFLLIYKESLALAISCGEACQYALMVASATIADKNASRK